MDNSGLFLISSIASLIGLGFAAFQIYQNNKNIKENTRTRETQILSNSFNKILEMENKLYTEYKEKDIKEWGSLFFNSIEYLAFMINKGFISDSRLKSFFEDAIVDWYEGLFLEKYSKEEIEDKKQFPEFKKFYHKIKSRRS